MDTVSLGVGVIAACLVSIFAQLNVFSEYGIVHGINGLLQILTGFYIAALAAVATFDGAGRGYDLDGPFDGDQAKLGIDDGDEYLTRRRFLSVLFGYLAVASLSLYLVGVIAMVAAPPLHEFLGESHLRLFLRGAFLLGYMVSLSHAIGATLLGLYFLSDRMTPSATKIVVTSAVRPPAGTD